MKLKQEKKDNRSGWNSYKEKGLNIEDKWFLISNERHSDCNKRCQGHNLFKTKVRI